MCKNMASEAKNEKNKTTLFYQTQKVVTVKVVLFFCFGHFFHSPILWGMKNKKWLQEKKVTMTFFKENHWSKIVFDFVKLINSGVILVVSHLLYSDMRPI